MLRCAVGLSVLLLASPGHAQGQKAEVPPAEPQPRAAPAAEPREEVPPDAAAYLAPLLDANPGRCLGSYRLASQPLPGQVAGEARPAGPAPLRRVVLAIDSSGSMAGRVGGETKMAAAQRAAADFLQRLGAEVEVAVVVFGHEGSAQREGRAASCAGIGTAAPMAADRVAARAAVDALRPVGWTPLAAAMERAATLFRDSPVGEQRLVVVSDGVETCGGDPVGVARRLHQSGLHVTVDIVGFDIAPAERAALAAVAAAGGGRFTNAETGRGLADALAETRLRIENLNRENTARISATNQANTTRINVTNAVNTARICTTNLLNTERIAFTNQSNRDRVARRHDEALYREARELLDARHLRIREALESYVAAAEGNRDDQLGQIQGALDRALAPAPRR